MERTKGKKIVTIGTKMKSFKLYGLKGKVVTTI